MSGFSDEDLKSFKGTHRGVHTCDGRCALIRRLEAAEEFAHGAALAFPALKYGDSYAAWRKSKGE